MTSGLMNNATTVLADIRAEQAREAATEQRRIRIADLNAANALRDADTETKKAVEAIGRITYLDESDALVLLHAIERKARGSLSADFLADLAGHQEALQWIIDERVAHDAGKRLEEARERKERAC